MSFVTRESTSPLERESKYRNGSAEILRSASARSPKAISCASFAIVRPLNTVIPKVANASATASPSSRARAAKSRSPAVAPAITRSVACPSTVGMDSMPPTMRAPKAITEARRRRSRRSRSRIRRTVPRKSSAFVRAGTPGPPGRMVTAPPEG